MPRSLAIALGLSAATHLAAAVVMLAPVAPVTPGDASVINIQLVPSAVARDDAPVPAPEPAAVNRRMERTPPTPTAARAPQPQVAATAPAPAPRPAPEEKAAAEPEPARLAATRAADVGAASDALRQQVGQLLSRHFQYPRLARKRGWEGIVELGLHIAADGRVSKVILHRSSTYPTLDRAALVAAGHVRRVPGAEVLLNQEGMNLVVPVHYRLIDS